MTATRCACPDLDVSNGIPTEPIKCACCGGVLRLTCASECGERHVTAALENAAHPGKNRRECARCLMPLPKARGRPRKFCDECLTPAERKQLEHTRAWNAKMYPKRDAA